MKKSQIASLQFEVNSCFVKMFDIRSKVVIEECQCYFNFDSVSDIIAKRTHTFFMTTPTVCCVVYAMHGLDYFVS